MNFPKYLNLAILCGCLAACAQPARDQNPQAGGETEADSQEATEDESISILRPEIDPPEPETTPEPLPPYKAVIGFPDGGTAIDEEAEAQLEAVLASSQLELGLPIALGAHSDSVGGDEANLDSSQERGLAVAQWLIERGVDAERITVIAFGEQNPIAPNALPDGSTNEEGRAANRRVEIEVASTPAGNNAEAEDESPADASVEARD